MDKERQRVHALCEEKGLPWAEAQIKSMQLPESMVIPMNEWVIAFKRREQEETERKQMQLTTEALAVAKLSAQAAIASAKHAKHSAWGTLAAAVIAAAALAISLVQAFASPEENPQPQPLAPNTTRT